MPLFQLTRYSGVAMVFPINLASSNMPGSHCLGPMCYKWADAFHFTPCTALGRTYDFVFPQYYQLWYPNYHLKVLTLASAPQFPLCHMGF